MQSELETTFTNIKILKNAALADYTNTDTGGPADWLAFPENVTEVKQLVKFGNHHNLPITVIGNASNLIVRDGGIAGLVIILTAMKAITVNDNQVTAQAGAALISATKVACEARLSGLEFAAGIPGSVGGAVFMNAGAYGGEIKDVLAYATVLTATGEVIDVTNDELEFGYRHSNIQDHQGEIVLAATFKLQPAPFEQIKQQMDDLNARRASKQPLEWPSCGSVFKRPTGYFAGKLIHDAGLQGYTSGGAQVSTKHAGFIINIGGGTATDYLKVIAHVQATVLAKFGVHLETEVRIIGRGKDEQI
ncbi:UDP-N-acetylmuramate dehydrogenase [Paucilactobacillus kaifaensis]|uniref:UDP-N-acetylmuramate dehydrogenase n=1 Tax=Paucilactobacillus kaifaensis TaxID=2559921 RepID=UPI0010F4925D|nr:UDP-N-acetylmuramate dehydrogenase [Paucilactobacillus kaifaensis]